MSHQLKDVFLFAVLPGLVACAGVAVAAQQPIHRLWPKRTAPAGSDLDQPPYGRANPETSPSVPEQRIRAGYNEMPGLGLTSAEAARLFGLEPETASAALSDLETRHFLRRARDGRFLMREQ